MAPPLNVGHGTEVAAVAAPAAVQTTCCGAFAPLPRVLVLHIFSLAPADARARCAAVCRPWRAELVKHPRAGRLWARLDLSPSSGVSCTITDDALLGAAALARGRLEALNLEGALLNRGYYAAISTEALFEVVAENADTLRELAVGGLGRSYLFSMPEVDAVCAATYGHALQRFEVHTACNPSTARQLLRQEAPYAAVRAWRLRISEFDANNSTPKDFWELTAAVAAHTSLRELSLWGAPLRKPAALDAVVNAALARQLSFVAFYDCSLSPASVPALARLLTSGTALTELRVWCVHSGSTALLNEHAALEQLCQALRRNTTLVTL